MNARDLVGKQVRWHNDPRTDSHGAMTVAAATRDGMVEVTGYSGLFAPHLFRVVTPAPAMTVDTKVRELAAAFIDDTLLPTEVDAMGQEKYHALIDRAAAAIQRAIEDECASIREELLP